MFVTVVFYVINVCQYVVKEKKNDLSCNSMEWFLYDRSLRHKRVKQRFFSSLYDTLLDDKVSIHFVKNTLFSSKEKMKKI